MISIRAEFLVTSLLDTSLGAEGLFWIVARDTKSMENLKFLYENNVRAKVAVCLFAASTLACISTACNAEGWIVDHGVFEKIPTPSLLSKKVSLRGHPQATLNDYTAEELEQSELRYTSLNDCVLFEVSDESNVDLSKLDWQEFERTEEIDLCLFWILSFLEPSERRPYLTGLGFALKAELDDRLSLVSDNSEIEVQISHYGFPISTDDKNLFNPNGELYFNFELSYELALVVFHESAEVVAVQFRFGAQ